MSEKKKKNEVAAEIDKMDIEPLTDDLLDSVAGGASNVSGCSCVQCKIK